MAMDIDFHIPMRFYVKKLNKRKYTNESNDSGQQEFHVNKKAPVLPEAGGNYKQLSEAVLNASLQTIVVVVLTVNSDEGDFAIHIHVVSNINTETSFAAELIGGGFAINSHDGGTTLNIVPSILAEGTFVTNVEVGSNSVIVAASVTGVGFDVHVRTCQCRRSEERSSRDGCQCRFNHSSLSMSRGVEPTDDKELDLFLLSMRPQPKFAWVGHSCHYYLSYTEVVVSTHCPHNVSDT